MGAMQRRKGASYERELVQRFREAMPGAEVKRGFQYRAGQEAPDVDCPVFWVEAKRGKQPNVRAALRQASQDAANNAPTASGKIPLAVIRDDREPAFVALWLEDFLELVKENWELGGK